MFHLLFLKAKVAASKQDNPNWHEAMTGEFADEFWNAACDKIEALEGLEAWEVIEEEEGMNIIDSTWAFGLKRFPHGLIKKFKTRFCERGDQQLEGIDLLPVMGANIVNANCRTPNCSRVH